jgi:hypothetical protein
VPWEAEGDLRSSEGRSDAIAEADEMVAHLLQIHTRFFRFPRELRLNKNLVRMRIGDANCNVFGDP